MVTVAETVPNLQQTHCDTGAHTPVREDGTLDWHFAEHGQAPRAVWCLYLEVSRALTTVKHQFVNSTPPPSQRDFTAIGFFGVT